MVLMMAKVLIVACGITYMVMMGFRLRAAVVPQRWC